MYEQACMANPKDKYYTKLLKALINDNNNNGAPFSDENIQQAFSIVVEKMEAELERNINKITMDTSFQFPVQKKGISTINDSGYNESNNQVDKISDSKEQVDASSRSSTDSAEQFDTSSNPRVDTHITE